jgi:hypothetical protein
MFLIVPNVLLFVLFVYLLLLLLLSNNLEVYSLNERRQKIKIVTNWIFFSHFVSKFKSFVMCAMCQHTFETFSLVFLYNLCLCWCYETDSSERLKIKQLNVDWGMWDGWNRGWIRRSLWIKRNIYFDTRLSWIVFFIINISELVRLVILPCISPQITVPQRFSIFLALNDFHGCWFPSVGCRFFSLHVITGYHNMWREKFTQTHMSYIPFFLFICLGNINEETVAVNRFIVEKENVLKSRAKNFFSSTSRSGLCTIT